jgi:hypothetical protein
MSIHHPRHSSEETSRRGDEIYECQIREQVEADNFGRVVAIDIESGAFALGDDALDSAQLLWKQSPDAEIWFVRVGHRAFHKFGGRYIAREP